MNSDKASYSFKEDVKEDNKALDIKDLVSKYIKQWPSVIACVILCMILAFTYLRFSVPIYTVKAKLLIKDERTDKKEGTKDHDLFNSNRIISNELEILTSRTLMKQVVEELQLWVTYERVGKFRQKDLYANPPLKFKLLIPSKTQEGRSFDITIKDDKHFVIRQPNSLDTISFGCRARNSVGLWQLSPSRDLKEYIGSTIRISVADPAIVADNYLRALTVQLSDEKTSVVSLSMKELVPERGRDILNKLIAAYNFAAIEDKNEVAKSTLKFIDDRLAFLTGELTSVEKHVEGYKSSRGLTDISSESKLFLDNVKANDAKLNEVNVQLQVIREIENYISSPNRAGTAPATIGISDPGLVVLIDRLQKLELERDKWLANTPEYNPIFDPLNKQIQSIKNLITDNIAGIKNSLLASRNQLLELNQNVEASIKKIPGQEREIVSIKRQQSIKEELYIYLLQKREEAAVSYASALPGTRTVDQAYYGLPESPSRPFTYALSILLGLVVPAGFIFTRDFFNPRITSSKGVEQIVQVPLLGELVQHNSSNPKVIEEGARTMIAEQFRILRTNLQSIPILHSGGKVTLVTSGMPGEGKSFVALNLGLALAAMGRKTIILELDFRNPSLSKSFNVARPAGLSNYLMKEVSKEEIVQSSDIRDLYTIGTGALPSNPSELLEQSEMTELFSWLRSDFDEIIIDSPPLQLVADALILSRYSDINLYIIRFGVTHWTHLDYVNQLYKKQKLKELHIVLNGIDASEKYGYNKMCVSNYYNSNPFRGLSVKQLAN